MDGSRQGLKDKKKIVVKIGSSSLQHPETGKLDLRKMEVLVRQLCDLKNRGKKRPVLGAKENRAGGPSVLVAESPAQPEPAPYEAAPAYEPPYVPSYEEEEREVEGKKYAVEVFPASDYQGETGFYFDENGKLAYVQQLPLENASVDIGESFYTIHTMDTAVDEKLLDASGYKLGE